MNTIVFVTDEQVFKNLYSVLFVFSNVKLKFNS